MNARRCRPTTRHGRPWQARSTPALGIGDQLLIGAVVIAVVGVPLAMGGRHPAGQALLTFAAFLSVMAALATRFASSLAKPQTSLAGFRVGLIEFLAFAGIALGCAQLVPVPHRYLTLLSQQYDTLLPLFSGHSNPAAMGAWDRVSLMPGETLNGLAIFFAQAVLVVLVARKFRTVDDVERLLKIVAMATTAFALLGVAQYVGGNGKFLWFYDHVHIDAGGVVKGTFSNRNHYASFLAAGVGAVLWWGMHPANGVGVMRSAAVRTFGWSSTPAVAGWLQQWRGGIGLLGVAVVLFAGLSSLSRGGAIATTAALLVAMSILAFAGIATTAVVVSFVGASLLAATALQIHGLDRLTGRLNDLVDAAFYNDGFSRLAVWKAARQTIEHFPWLGTGIGTHAEVSPIYMPSTGSTIYTHAENSYLNLGVETGLIGLGVAVAAMLAGLIACAIVAWRGTGRERAVTAALAAGLVASAVHAAGDFIWYVPACSTLAMLMGAAAVSMASAHMPSFAPLALRLDRVSAVIVAGFLTIMLGAIGTRQVAALWAEPDWNTAVRENRKLVAAAAEQGDDETLAAGVNRVVTALERVVHFQPDHPRAWALLAVARLERFGLRRRLAGDEATLVDLREAAVAASFASRADCIAWLRSTAPNDAGELELAAEEARRAVHVCPLAGDAWCALAAVSFLDFATPATTAALVNQAVLVRPKDGRVLFEAGNQSALQGDTPRAVEWWRTSFATGPEMRQRILALLAAMEVPPSEVCNLLAPQLDGLRAIDTTWSRIAKDDQMREVRSRRLDAVLMAVHSASATDQRGPLVQLHLEAAGLQSQFGDMAAARTSLEEAVAVDPGSYTAHLARADHAIAEADWRTAQREVEWCLLRRPDNRQLHDKLKTISRAQAEMSGRAPRPR